MSLPTREYLLHILDETAYIMTNAKGISKADFLKDETLKRAYVRSIEVIGEAVKQLPAELRQAHSTIDWRAIAGMRDRLAHKYFGVDYEIVWDVVTHKLPMLDTVVKDILKQEYLHD